MGGGGRVTCSQPTNRRHPELKQGPRLRKQDKGPTDNERKARMSDLQTTEYEYRYADAVLPDGGIHTGVRTEHAPASGRIEARYMAGHPIKGYEHLVVPTRIAVEFRDGGSTSELIFTVEQWQAVIGLVQQLMSVEAVSA